MNRRLEIYQMAFQNMPMILIMEHDSDLESRRLRQNAEKVPV